MYYFSVLYISFSLSLCSSFMNIYQRYKLNFTCGRYSKQNGIGMCYTAFIFNLSRSLFSFAIFSQDIKRHDQGVYRCRIDSRTSQTQSYTYNLSVISEYIQMYRHSNTWRVCVFVWAIFQERCPFGFYYRFGKHNNYNFATTRNCWKEAKNQSHYALLFTFNEVDASYAHVDKR